MGDVHPAAELRQAAEGIRGEQWGCDSEVMSLVALWMESMAVFYDRYGVTAARFIASGRTATYAGGGAVTCVAAARAYLASRGDGGG